MIDNDDVGFSSALPHPGDEAFLVLRAFGADAVLGRRGDILPEREILGQILDLCPVAGLGPAAPLVDDADEQRLVLGPAETAVHLAEAGVRRPVTVRVESMQAEVVATPFHVRRGERNAE